MEYIKAKTIVNRNKKNSWFGYEYTMNIYRGCNQGCIYCDSRSDCYGIKDFDRVRTKENALMIIRDDLRSKTSRGVICTGSMSDPYNVFEKDLLLTRNALQLVHAYKFGVGVITKSPLVTRDIDILMDISKQATAMVKISITTADDSLAKKIETGASSPSKRFSALKQLTDHGLFAGVLLMPLLPFIQDTEEHIAEIVEKAVENGAKFIYPRFGVTLRGNQKEWYYNKLDQTFPGLKQQYISLYKDKMYCNSPNSRQLYAYFKRQCKAHNILFDMEDIIKASRRGFKYGQLSLFGLSN